MFRQCLTEVACLDTANKKRTRHVFAPVCLLQGWLQLAPPPGVLACQTKCPGNGRLPSLQVFVNASKSKFHQLPRSPNALGHEICSILHLAAPCCVTHRLCFTFLRPTSQNPDKMSLDKNACGLAACQNEMDPYAKPSSAQLQF